MNTVADDRGEPEELLANLNEAEADAAAVRNPLKAICKRRC